MPICTRVGSLGIDGDKVVKCQGAGNDVGTQYTSSRDTTQNGRSRLPSRGKSQGRGSVAEIAPHHMLWLAEGYHQQCLKKGGCMGQNGAKQCYAPTRCYGS
ncbi:TPA: hypothetical protein ACH3X2_004246 [Trebouxia sp. C0005]